MWSDNDIDKAFQRLNPPDPEPAPFPLDGWHRLEEKLDKTVIERAVRRRLLQFFAAEVAVVLLVALGWLLWPAGQAGKTKSRIATTANKTMLATSGEARTSAAAPAGTTAIAHAPAQTSASAIRPLTPTKPASSNAAATEAPAVTAKFSNPKPPLVGNEAPRRSRPATLASSQRWGGASTEKRKPVQRQSIDVATTATAGTLSDEARTRRAPRVRSATQAYIATDNRRKNRKLRANNAAATASKDALSLAVVENKQATDRASAIQQTSATAAHNPATATGRNAAEPKGQPTDKHAAETTPAVKAAAQGLAATAATPNPNALAANPDNTTLTPLISALETEPPTLLPTPLATVAVVPLDVPAPVRQPRFYIGLVAAPDVTTVKFLDVERPMLNLGVTLEYRLTQRLRVSTGLLRANKSYEARREDYDWSGYSKVYTRSFNRVDGACTVLDIPLNLRYDFLVQPEAPLFGSVGLPSFFMQHEKYSYDYVEYNTPQVWSRSYVNENRNLFSVLNLSAGYERSLGSHWRVQAEPYLKLPLAGIGAGKVQLTSAGVFFGVKYGW